MLPHFNSIDYRFEVNDGINWGQGVSARTMQTHIHLHACPVLSNLLSISFSFDAVTLAEAQVCGSWPPAMKEMKEWEGMLHFYYTLYSLLDGAC